MDILLLMSQYYRERGGEAKGGGVWWQLRALRRGWSVEAMHTSSSSTSSSWMKSFFSCFFKTNLDMQWSRMSSVMHPTPPSIHPQTCCSFSLLIQTKGGCLKVCGLENVPFTQRTSDYPKGWTFAAITSAFSHSAAQWEKLSHAQKLVINMNSRSCRKPLRADQNASWSPSHKQQLYFTSPAWHFPTKMER